MRVRTFRVGTLQQINLEENYEQNQSSVFSVSLDGFGAGPDQSLENPLGLRGTELHQWFFPTRVFQALHGDQATGTTGVDNRFGERSFENVGAWILGRNMFGPVRGPWPEESWRGWWGENPGSAAECRRFASFDFSLKLCLRPEPRASYGRCCRNLSDRTKSEPLNNHGRIAQGGVDGTLTPEPRTTSQLRSID